MRRTQQQLGNYFSICLKTEENKENPCRDDRVAGARQQPDKQKLWDIALVQVLLLY
jgi:hypothetical protein